MLPTKLRHIETFIEVARQKSIQKAADALHVSQPAVTKTMRELEEGIGVALYQRDGRGIRLTANGEVFLRHAGAAIASLRQGLDSVGPGRGGFVAPIRIGALPTVASAIMPQAVHLFLQESPAGKLRVITGENRTILDQLRLGELDIVVGRLAAPELMVGLSFEHLYSEVVRFVVRPGHALLASNSIFNDLADYLVLIPTPASIIRPYVDRLLIANGSPPISRQIETVSDTFARAFVRSSDAIWIISSGVVANELADGSLVALPVDTTETQGPVGLTVRTDAPTLPGSEMLAHAIRVVSSRLRNADRSAA
jgi:LysR family pca operon transcriptional activator